jgi:hypothetical protein
MNNGKNEKPRSRGHLLLILQLHVGILVVLVLTGGDSEEFCRDEEFPYSVEFPDEGNDSFDGLDTKGWSVPTKGERGWGMRSGGTSGV